LSPAPQTPVARPPVANPQALQSKPAPARTAPPPYRPFATTTAVQRKPRRYVRAISSGGNAIRGILQAKYVTHVADSPAVSSEILDELEKMMTAAHNSKGQASPNSQLMTTLSSYDSDFKKTAKIDSQNTFGVGASSYFPGVSTVVMVGSGKYASSIKGSSSDEAIHLGSRPACTHGEVAIIQDYPGVQGIVTTQKACMFCYGLLCSRGYQHQGLRDNPWPQKWTHDYMKFKLHILGTNASSKAPIVEIKWGEDSRWYWVEILG
jgi:hypothetical protein